MAGTPLIASGEPEEQVMGRVVFYSHPDDNKPVRKVLTALTANGLDQFIDALPDVRQGVHVFQSACRAGERTPLPVNGTRTEIRAQEVLNDAAECVYQVTIEVWDKAHAVINHKKGMRVVFRKSDERITVDKLDAYDKMLKAVETHIREDFAANGKTIPGQKVRAFVRSTVLALDGQNLRRKAGGVYFVPREYTDPDGKRAKTGPLLDGIAGFLTDLYGERGDFHQLACIDSDAEKEMVRKHFALNANKELEDFVVKALGAARSGRKRKVRSDLLTNIVSGRRKIIGQLQEFEKLVDAERADIEANLGALDQALEDLQTPEED